MTSFYEALRDKDASKLLGALDPDFLAVASAGMPLGVGRAHRGAMTALRELWGVVHRFYDIAPVPAAVWLAGDGTVVVHGWYEGVNRRTGTPVHAEFVHLLRVEDGVIVELRQITDTIAWGSA